MLELFLFYKVSYPFKSAKHAVMVTQIQSGGCIYTYLVGVVVRVANHMVHPVWLRSAYGTNGCLLLDSLTSAGNKDEKPDQRELTSVAYVLVHVLAFSVVYDNQESTKAP